MHLLPLSLSSPLSLFIFHAHLSPTLFMYLGTHGLSLPPLSSSSLPSSSLLLPSPSLMNPFILSAILESTRGYITLGASVTHGIEIKGIDTLQDCIKKCATAGGGIAPTMATVL